MRDVGRRRAARAMDCVRCDAQSTSAAFAEFGTVSRVETSPVDDVERAEMRGVDWARSADAGRGRRAATRSRSTRAGVASVDLDEQPHAWATSRTAAATSTCAAEAEAEDEPIWVASPSTGGVRGTRGVLVICGAVESTIVIVPGDVPAVCVAAVCAPDGTASFPTSRSFLSGVATTEPDGGAGGAAVSESPAPPCAAEDGAAPSEGRNAWPTAVDADGGRADDSGLDASGLDFVCADDAGRDAHAPMVISFRKTRTDVKTHVRLYLTLCPVNSCRASVSSAAFCSQRSTRVKLSDVELSRAKPNMLDCSEENWLGTNGCRWGRNGERLQSGP